MRQDVFIFEVTEFENGVVKEMLVTVVRMLTPNNPELAQAYQRKLSNLLT